MSNLSIVEKIRLFSEAAENLLDEIPPEEIEALSKDIATSAEHIWEYIGLLETDAQRLSTIAMKHAEVAAKQKKKAARLKDLLKYALKSNGFTKLKVGTVQMSLVEARKAVPKRPANENDFYAMPAFINVKFGWKREPDVSTWDLLPDFVEPAFTWDLKKLKEAGKDSLIEYEISDRLTVKIGKED